MARAQSAAAADLGKGVSCAAIDANRALLLCALTWGLPEQISSPDLPSPSRIETRNEHSPWRWLEPGWRHRLSIAWDEHKNKLDPAEALELLRQSLRFQSHADLDQVHPSWWARALQDESPAVQRLIGSQGPEALTEAVLATLKLTPGDLRPDRDPDPEVLSWVLSLWTERLVGGEPLCLDEPPVIVALASHSPIQRYRLCHAAGLAKIVLANAPETMMDNRPLDQERRGWFLERLAPRDPRAEEWASRDLRTVVRWENSRRRQVALLGLATMARLLADCDPFRVRWTLQHLPYPIAKRIRSLMPGPQKRSIAASCLESLLLKTAWERLTLEGRVTLAHPKDDTRESDVC
jgi:hypothetical protein